MFEQPLYRMPSTPLQTRWYTFENREGQKGAGATARSGRKGAPATALPKDSQLVLADIASSGTIRRIWMTLFDHSSPEALRGLKIEMYWDGASTPAVQAPLGDFFCHSMGHAVAFQNACFSSPEGRSFNCTIPMPFQKKAPESYSQTSRAETTASTTKSTPPWATPTPKTCFTSTPSGGAKTRPCCGAT